MSRLILMGSSVDIETNLNVHEDNHDSRLRKSSSSIANRFICMEPIQIISYHLCFIRSEFSSLAFEPVRIRTIQTIISHLHFFGRHREGLKRQLWVNWYCSDKTCLQIIYLILRLNFSNHNSGSGTSASPR